MDSFNINRTPVLKFTLPFILGIISHKLFPEIYESSFEFIVFLILYFLISTLCLRNHYTLVGGYWLLFFFLFGGVHSRLTQLQFQKTHFSKYSESEMMILRIDETVESKNSIRCLSSVIYVGNDSLEFKRCTGQIMAYLNKGTNTELSIGQCLLVNYNFFLEKSNSNPYVFDYKEYLNNRGIYHRAHYKDEEVMYLSLEKDNLNIKAKRLRQKCLDHLSSILSSENNIAVAAAMILGERKLLNEDLYDAYTDTGAVHVLAVSGLHVGIIGWFISLLLRLFPSRTLKMNVLKSLIIITCIWIFAYITGLAAAVTRASIMFSLYFFGQGIMRQRNSLNILATAALTMLIYDPNYLYQAGFQFSFLALLGILTFYRPIYRTLSFKWVPLQLLWSGVAVSISAQLLVSPLAIGYFHKLPVYFWLSGIFAVPAAYLILALGLCSLVIAFSIGPNNLLMNLIGLTLDTIITWFNKIIFFIQDMPFCSADNLWISPWSILIFYIGLAFFTIFIKSKEVIYLIGLLICLLVQVLLHNYENHMAWKKSTLYVYDNYNGTVIDYMTSGLLYEHLPRPMEQRSIDFVAKNNRLYNRIQSKSSLQELAIEQRAALLSINGQLILIDPQKEDLKWTSSVPIDLLVLTSNSYGSLYQLNKNYCPKQVILDGTVKNKKWVYRKAAENLEIPIHITSIHGAYTVQI